MEGGRIDKQRSCPNKIIPYFVYLVLCLPGTMFRLDTGTFFEHELVVVTVFQN